MQLSSILTKSLKLALALMIAAPLVVATDAEAQRKKRSRSAPKAAQVAPWQDAIKKLYRPLGRQNELDKARRSLHGDPGKAIGLPSNEILRSQAPGAPTVEPVTPDASLSRLDFNGDGSISRNEYIQGQSRLSVPGVRSSRLRQRQRERLGSQYRRSDLNGDGRVTPDEVSAARAGRY